MQEGEDLSYWFVQLTPKVHSAALQLSCRTGSKRAIRDWCVKQHGNVICGACFHFWLEKKWKRSKKKRHNQSGKRLTREKSSTSPLSCSPGAALPGSSVQINFVSIISTPGAEGYRQRAAYWNGSCLFIREIVTSGNPSPASKCCICLQRHHIVADRWRAADTIPVYFLWCWWFYIGY